MGKFIDATLRLIDDFTKPMANAVSAFEERSKSMMRAGKDIEKVGKGISNTGKTLTATVTTPIMGLGISAIKTAADFEKGMSTVQSICGASGKDLVNLSDKAREMGAKTKYSATEATEAFKYMGMAGWDAQQMMDGIEGVMYLAGATGGDLASTSDIVTDALTAFGLQASDTNMFVDVLAQTANKANTDVSMLGESFKYVAPVAGAMKYSVQDVSVALGIMANSGIKSSQAGTALRTWITNMAKPTDSMATAMEKLGLSLTDSEGNMKSFATVMQETRGAFANLTEDQKAQYAATIAGKEGMSGMLAIVNASDGDFEKLTQAINASDGACKKMYDTANDNLTGQLTILGSTLESVAITFGNKMLPYIKKGTTYIQELGDRLNSLTDAQVESIIKWAGFAASVGPGLLVLGKTTTVIGSTVSSLGKMGKGLKEMGERAKVAKGILGTLKMPKLTLPGSVKALGSVITSFAGKSKVLQGTAKLGGGLFKGLGSGTGKIFSAIGNGAGKAAAPVKALGSTIASFAGKSKVLQGTAKVGSGAFSILSKGIKAINSPFTKGAQVIGTAGKALFTFLGPAGTAILVIGAIVAAGVLLYKNWDKVTAAAKKLGVWVKSVFQACGFDIQSFTGSAGANLQKFIGKAQELWELVGPVVKKIGELWMKVFQVELAGIIGGAIGLFGSLLQSVSDVFAGLTRIFGGIVDFISGVFTHDWEKIWSGVRDIFGGIFETLVALAKAPLNGVISLINGAIAGINNLGIKIPDWVPRLGGKEFKINIPTIQMLYTGTNNWRGGPAMIHDRGAEIVDLPSGTRVYPHDKSLQMAREEGKKKVTVIVQKIADKVEISDPQDVDRIMDRFVKKLEETAENTA